jgi:UDP-galactopyranose mutase
MKPIAIVGAGLSGATAAITLARHGFNVEVFEVKDHVGGNCHTERLFADQGVNTMVHVHGPHIFHTNNRQVYEFVDQFERMMPHDQRTKAMARGSIFSFPINLHTMSQLFGRPLTPESAKNLIDEEIFSSPVSSRQLGTMEGHLLSTVGSTIYETFFRDYTLKQWGRHPVDLPASVAQRIPVRFNYDDRVFADRFQGVPRGGYTSLVEAMLDHPRIRLRLSNDTMTGLDGTPFYAHTIYTGALDEAFKYEHGCLPYRSLEIAHEVRPELDDATGNTVINFCDGDTPWTRQTEHRHFTPWEEGKGTVVSREFSREWRPGLLRYYPVRLAQEEKTLAAYEDQARRCDTVTFMGRLGTFRYLNMDQAVEAAIRGTREVIRRLR